MREKINILLIALQVFKVGAYVETESIHASLFGGKVCDFTDSNIFNNDNKGDCSAQQKKYVESSYNT